MHGNCPKTTVCSKHQERLLAAMDYTPLVTYKQLLGMPYCRTREADAGYTGYGVVQDNTPILRVLTWTKPGR